MTAYESPTRLEDDFEWGLHDAELQARFGGQVVAIHRRHVWGAGANLTEASRAAQSQPGCPALPELVFVPVPCCVVEEGSEHDWCLTDAEVQERWGGLVTAIHGRKVWGAGHDRAEAWQEAQRQPGCPPIDALAFVIVPHVLPDR